MATRKAPSRSRRKSKAATRRGLAAGGATTEARDAGSEGWSVSVTPVFRRDPDAPVFYTNLIDVRTTGDAFHLLLFVPPAADPDEIVEEQGEPRLIVRSTAEVILPPEAIQPLIQSLALQYRNFVRKHLEEDAAKLGIELDENLHFEGIDEFLDLNNTEEKS